MNYYGVTQFVEGTEYRSIYSEEFLQEVIGTIRNNEELDISWPDSKGSSTIFRELTDDKEVREFLCSRAEGPRNDDPTLRELYEYELYIDTLDENSCTQAFLDKFSYTADDLFQGQDSFGYNTKMKQMIEEMLPYKEKISVDDHFSYIDWKNPYSGMTGDMHYSELCDNYNLFLQYRNEWDVELHNQELLNFTPFSDEEFQKRCKLAVRIIQESLDTLEEHKLYGDNISTRGTIKNAVEFAFDGQVNISEIFPISTLNSIPCGEVIFENGTSLYYLLPDVIWVKEDIEEDIEEDVEM